MRRLKSSRRIVAATADSLLPQTKKDSLREVESPVSDVSAAGHRPLRSDEMMPVTGVDSIFGISPGYYLLAALAVLILTGLIVAMRA